MEIILKYFKGLSEEQIAQFKQLEALYTDWNSKINVISRKDIDKLYLHHVLHSMVLGNHRSRRSYYMADSVIDTLFFDGLFSCK